MKEKDIKLRKYFQQAQQFVQTLDHNKSLRLISFVQVRVFGFSMGYGTGPLPILDYLACKTGGGHAVVDSVSDVRHQSVAYLKKLSEILALSYSKKSLESRPITW